MLNVVTFAAHICNQLTEKIIDKFNQSKDDYFERISNKYRQDIKALDFNSKNLISGKAERFSDGSYKTYTNLWDLLDQEDKQEAISLKDLEEIRKEEIRSVRKYLIPLATKCLQVDSTGKIISMESISLLKFLSCLPDFISQDKELITREIKDIGRLSEEELFDIYNFPKKLSEPERNSLETEIKLFIQENKNEQIEAILASLYALDFLVDF